MTVGEKIQEVLKGIKVVENKEYNLMTISKEIWDSDYQGTPTIPLSVIEDIKADIEELGVWHEKLLIETIDIKRVLDIIDRKVNEVKHEH